MRATTRRETIALVWKSMHLSLAKVLSAYATAVTIHPNHFVQPRLSDFEKPLDYIMKSDPLLICPT